MRAPNSEYTSPVLDIRFSPSDGRVDNSFDNNAGEMLPTHMTMVLSLLTHSHVVQVSDRRLIKRLPDGSLQPSDDERNKATFFCDRATFAYTGPAELDGTPTDHWLTEAMLGATRLGDALERVVDRATAAFKSPGLRGRRFAIGCVGWSGDKEKGLTPFYSTISSFIKDGQEQPNVASDFQLEGYKLAASTPFHLWSLGQHLARRIEVRLERDIAAVLKRGLSTTAALRLLIAAMRVASSENMTVGRGVMGNCIPKAMVGGDETLVLSGPPREDAATFAYLPAAGGQLVVYGPNTVCNGSASLGLTFKHS